MSQIHYILIQTNFYTSIKRNKGQNCFSYHHVILVKVNNIQLKYIFNSLIYNDIATMLLDSRVNGSLIIGEHQ